MIARTTAPEGFAAQRAQERAQERSRRRAPDLPDECGGARVIDLAICLILAVTLVGLMHAAL